MLAIESLSYGVPGRILFDDASLSVSAGERIGVIGRNGNGKTTFINILMGKTTPNSGSVKWQPNVRRLTIPQQDPSGEILILDYIKEADERLQALKKQEAELSPSDKLWVEVSEQIMEIEEAYDLQAPKVLKGLGFKEEQLNDTLDSLSGGLRRRLALASVILQQPDFLILDEPTNHLDLESLLWLTEYLKNYPKSKVLMIISHDKHFLDALTNVTVHIGDKQIFKYSANCSGYREYFQHKIELAFETNKRLDREIDRKQEFVNKFKAKPKWSTMAGERQRQIEKMKESKIDIPLEEPVAALHFPDVELQSQSLLELQGVSVGYPGKTVLQQLNLSVQADSRIALVGRNGNGKSTLCKLLAGTLASSAGQVIKHGKLRIGYFDQHQTDSLDGSLTVYQQVQSRDSKMNDADIRSFLAQMGFEQDKVDTITGNLSGGEKTRLLLAILSMRNPNLLILDEPTNNLDLETREVLSDALKEFKGAVILVSHDWDFIALNVSECWIVSQGKVQIHKAGLEDYKTKLLQHLAVQNGTAISSSNAPTNKMIRNANGASSSSSSSSNNSNNKKNNGASSSNSNNNNKTNNEVNNSNSNTNLKKKK